MTVMQQQNGDVYMLDRSAEESSRLNTQHDLYTRALGYLIKPEPLQQLRTQPTPPKILDVGTGTAAWPIAVAGLLQDQAVVEAVDLSSAQFPPPGTLPSNVSLSVADMKAPVAPERLAAFDVVHLRLLQYSLDAEEWASVVSNMVQMLKPGGWLQWEEIDLAPTHHALRSTPDSRVSAMQEGFDTLFAISRARCEFATQHLWDAMSASGLEGVARDIVCSDRDPAMRRTAASMEPLVLEGVTKQRFGEDRDELKKIRQLTARIWADIETGAYINFYIHSVSGRKPLANA